MHRCNGAFSLRILLACFFCIAPSALAQAPRSAITVHVDPARTQIRWTLTNWLHNVHGTFLLKGGVFTFDPATGVADGELLVDLDTGNSGNPRRDRVMKSSVLETTTYPEAIFHPEKVTGKPQPGATQTITLDGLFTLHAHDHPFQMKVQVQMTDSQHATATTHFVIPYVAWGLKDPSTALEHVGKKVDVYVAAKATVEGLP
jgi:polyisoprenoid-binding protein YceI